MLVFRGLKIKVNIDLFIRRTFLDSKVSSRNPYFLAAVNHIETYLVKIRDCLQLSPTDRDWQFFRMNWRESVFSKARFYDVIEQASQITFINIMNVISFQASTCSSFFATELSYFEI